MSKNLMSSSNWLKVSIVSIILGVALGSYLSDHQVFRSANHHVYDCGHTKISHHNGLLGDTVRIARKEEGFLFRDIVPIVHPDQIVIDFASLLPHKITHYSDSKCTVPAEPCDFKLVLHRAPNSSTDTRQRHLVSWVANDEQCYFIDDHTSKCSHVNFQMGKMRGQEVCYRVKAQ